ncbi:MAG: sporulation protein YqfD, partial [Faecalibacillus sp.]
MKLGYDYIVIETDQLVSFLKDAKYNHLTMIHLKQIDHHIYSFYTPIYQRYILNKMHLSIVKSVGILHYLCIIFDMPHILFTLSFVISLMIYPHYIYHYQIEGTNPTLNKQIKIYLEKNIPYFHHSLTYSQLNKLYDQIKDTFSKEIDYLNIYQNGGIVHVKYTNAVNNKKQTLDYH